MSRYFFTADCHFGHANIILYSNRKPFYTDGVDNYPDTTLWKSEENLKQCLNKMDETLIENWNKVVNPEDTVYHLGDFRLKSSSTSRRYEENLNGKIVHIKGNHDENNGVKTLITQASMEFGRLSVLAQHHPPIVVPEGYDLVLCGHVHNNWEYKIVNNIPVINVGMDVRNYFPMSLDSVLKLYDQIRKEIYQKAIYE